MRKRTPSPARRTPWLRHAIETLIVAVILIFFVRVAVQNFHIEGQSMEPSLHDREYILVNKIAYLVSAPGRGDIVVFQYPKNPQEKYIKRIIAIPGDIISVVDNQITVDGVHLDEPYINQADNYNPFSSFRNRIVEPNEYFVMGDNRGNSSDSREWGLVPRHNIIGRAMLVYWPLNTDNFGALPDASRVFAAVHQ